VLKKNIRLHFFKDQYIGYWDNPSWGEEQANWSFRGVWQSLTRWWQCQWWRVNWSNSGRHELQCQWWRANWSRRRHKQKQLRCSTARGGDEPKCDGRRWGCKTPDDWWCSLNERNMTSQIRIWWILFGKWFFFQDIFKNNNMHRLYINVKTRSCPSTEKALFSHTRF
jgi:hypothetical protein